MSGSNDVKVTISADASNYSAGMKAATDAAQQLSSSLTSVGSVLVAGRNSFVRAGTDVTGLAANMLAAGNTAAQVAKQLGLSATDAAALGQATAGSAAGLQAAADGLQNIGGAAGRTAAQMATTVAETIRLNETIARVMSGLGPVATTASTAAQGIQSVGQAATQAAPALAATAASEARLDAAARQVMSSLSPAAIAMLRVGTSAASAGPSIDAAAAAEVRLDAAARQVLSSLSPAAIAMLRTSTATTEMNAAMTATASATTGAAAGVISVAKAATNARDAARELINAAASIAATSAPLKNSAEDYKNLAAAALNAGLTAQDVAKMYGLPVASVKAFEVALRAALESMRQTTDETKRVTVVTAEMSREIELAARLEATCAKVLADMATAQRQSTAATVAGNAATDKATAATQAMGSANQRAGEQLISAGSKFASAGQNVTALYHALIAMGDSAEVAAKKLGVTLPEAADKAEAASHRAATGFAGITREVFVLGHEAMSGRFSMIPGSLLTLAERSGGLMSKIGELASEFTFFQGAALFAVGAVTTAIIALTARTVEAINAIRQMGNTAAGLGQDVARVKAEAAELNENLKGIGVGQTEALKVVGGLEQITEANKQQKTDLAYLAVAYAKAFGITPEKAMEDFVAAMHNGGAGVRQLIDEHKLWDEQNGLVQRSQLALAEGTHNSTAAFKTLFDTLHGRFPEFVDNAKAFKAAGKDMEFEAGPAQQQLPESKSRAEDPSIAQQRQETLGHTGEMQRQLILTQDLEAAQKQLASATTTAQRDLANESIRATTVLLEEEKKRGDDTLAQKQESELKKMLSDRAQAGGEARQMSEDLKNIEIRYWDELATKGNQTEQAITRERGKANDARRILAEQEARDAGTYSQEIARRATMAGEAALVAADKSGKGRVAMTEASTNAEYQVFLKASLDMTRVGKAADRERLDFAARAARLHSSLLKEESSSAAASAKEALAAWIATMHERENAAGTSSAAAIALQQQVVDRLKSMGAAQTRNYATEKSRQDTMEREHADKALALAEQTMSKQRQIDSSDIAFQRSVLDEQVAAMRMSKAQEMGILSAFAAEKHASELKELSATLAGLDKEREAHAGLYAQINIANNAGLTDLETNLGQQSAAYQKLYNEIRALKQQWLTEDMRMNRDAANDLKQQWEKGTAPISSAIDSEVGAVIRGNETIGLGVQKMLGNIVVGYAQMGVKKLMQLASDRAAELLGFTTTETAKTGIAAGGEATRAGIGRAATATENANVLVRVWRWLFGETAKTAATTTGTATRTGINTVATARENVGVLGRVARWIFGESAETAATATGTAARSAANLTADATANAGLLVRIARWIAGELGLTAATDAGAGERAAAQTLADSEAVTAGLATNLTQAMSFAALGATAAGASVAAIPMVGWAMVPGVAAGTYGALSAYAALTSLAVGAYNVPQNMTANLHAGEMVVPETFASGIRGAMSGGGGGDTTQNLTYAPHVSGGGGDLGGMMRQQAASMKSFLWHATRNGALTLPGRG